MFGGTPPSGGLFGSNTSSPFASTPAFGGASTFGASTPAFGASTPAPAFGSSTPAFASSTPAFGANTPFGASPSTFGSSTPAFGASTPAFGASTSGFGSSTPAFGSPAPAANLFGSTPQPGTFGQSPFGQTPLFGQTTPQTPFGQSSGSTYGQAQTPLFGQQTQPSLFGSATPAQFGQPQTSSMPFMQQTQPSIFGNLQQPMFNTGQLTTQMAPVAPLAIPLPDREIQAIVDAYKDEPGSPRYAFKHLLLSITDPSMRVKPPGVPELMWAEAMNKLEGMENGGRMWPELMLGFKDLSNRLKLQDEALAADFQRLQATESNVKMLQRHFQVDTLPWIQRLRQKEQELQRRLLRVMRIVEALEVKGLRMPLTRGEAQLGELLRSLARQLHSTSGELPRKVDSVLSLSRVQAGVGGSCASTILETGKIDDQSLVDIQEVLKQQTEAITRLAAVLKRDMRDIEIMTSDDAEMSDRFLGTEIYKNKLKEPGVKFFPSTFS